jgi:subtilisin family serine protease
MKTLLCFIVFVVAFSPFAVECKVELDEKSKVYALLNQKNAGQLLLVGFTDRSINSLKSSASPTSYRPRGGYKSSTWSERVTDDLADDYGLEKMAEWPMTAVDVHCVVYRVLDKSAVASTIGRLAKDHRVEIVQSMNVFKTRANAQKIQNDPYFKLQTNLQQMEISLAHGKATGKDITIGLIDTGVDLDHPDLAGQIAKNQNFVGEISTSFSTDIHGTAIAGIMVAKRDNAKGIIGVAPNAKVVALKACWPDKKDDIEAVCNSFTLALAVNTAIKAGVDILNMSLTGPEDPILSLLLKEAIKKGIIVVAADTGSGKASENFPASLNEVISVQSINKPGTLSNNISAPGEKVLTTLPHGTYDFISGSSIAAAEISGVIALLMELKPNLNQGEAQAVLQKSKLKTKEGLLGGINANLALSSLCETSSCNGGNLLGFDLKLSRQ